MTNSKTTKKALLSSALALTMCVAMLIATTFAWFTDTASTSVNKIQAGTLTVDIVDAQNTDTSLKGGTLTFQSADPVAGAKNGEDLLWEPGCTYRTSGFKIKSTGTLALKYKLALTGVDGSAELLDVIKFSVVTETDGTFTAIDLDSFEGELTAADTLSETFYIQGHMDESAGNAYQGKELTGIGITVYATQLEAEYDSNGKTYDKDATYSFVSAGAVAKVTTDGDKKTTGTVTVESTTKVGSESAVTLTVPVGVTMEDNASKVTVKVDEAEEEEANITLDVGQEKKTLEVTVAGVASTNDKPLKVTFFIEKGLENVKLYHTKGSVTESMTAKTSEDTVTADKEFYYNRETGKVTIMSKTFSPFTYVFDSNATVDRSGVVYPAGVTTESFTGSNVAAYVGSDGAMKYTTSVNEAIKDGATTIYLKEGSNAESGRTKDLTNDLAIYANGADFQYKEIAINNTSSDVKSEGKTKNITLKVYNAKNVRIWGSAPDDGYTTDITLDNCTYKGSGINGTNADGIFYIAGATGAVNLTMKDCEVSGSNQGVYSNANGTITINDTTFEQCGTGVKISHDASGVCTVNIAGTKFIKCGCTSQMAGTVTWLASNSSAIRCKTETGTMNLNMTNVAITETIGDGGDMQIGKSGKTVNVTVTAENVTIDGKAWTYSAG